MFCLFGCSELVVGRTQDFAGSAVVVDVPGLGKMILNIFTPQLDDVEICCLRPSQSPLFVLKFDLLLATSQVRQP